MKRLLRVGINGPSGWMFQAWYCAYALSCRATCEEL